MLNHMQGAKLLHSWLTSDGKTELDPEFSAYPEIRDPGFKVPSILGSYELDELAKILINFKPPLTWKILEQQLSPLAQMKKAIVITNLRLSYSALGIEI